ncbi:MULTISPECIES: hypothetical protein [Shewanella]|uniref:Uncharacterized protein n=1 Tax=Shewanella chilikensis TaxID=558541 RepID=A0A6G7LR96_9GAMM|nr:hypothetical protein GII14_08355 [Shewanella chilikensis]
MDNTAIITTTQEGNAKNMTPQKQQKPIKIIKLTNNNLTFTFILPFTVHLRQRQPWRALKQRHGKHQVGNTPEQRKVVSHQGKNK